MKNKNIWIIEKYDDSVSDIYNANFRIVENHGVNFPICHFPKAFSEKQSNALLERQEQYAKLIVCAPEMLEILEEWRSILFTDYTHQGLINKIITLLHKSDAVVIKATDDETKTREQEW